MLIVLLLPMMLSFVSFASVWAASAPDWSNNTCYGSGNPLTAGYKYQCTWYVWGRVRECLGIKMSGRTSQYVNSSVTGGYSSSPSTGSVAVYTNDTGSILHVAYIESFDGNNVTYSEGNNNGLGTGDQKYYTATFTLSDFTSTTIDRVKNGCTTVKYIPLVSSGTTVAPSVRVSTGTADNITSTNAKLHGSVSKPAGTWITSCGIYLGTSTGDMKKQNTETVGSAANNKDGGTGFDIWYDLGSELKIALTQNTTYYYQVYVVCEGRELKGEIKSFQTKGGTVVYDQEILINVPANCKVQGYETVESTTNYRKIDAQANPYTILATKYAVLSNGNRRFYYTDNQGYGIWFDNSSLYTATYYISSITTEVSEVTVPLGDTVAVRFSCTPSEYTEKLVLYGQWECPAVIDGNQILITGKVPTISARQVEILGWSSERKATVDVNVVDNISPEIGNITFSDIDASGFTVSWETEDNYQLAEAKTKILAWSGQEDEEQAQTAEIIENKVYSAAKISYQARVKTTDYNGATDEYFVRIYAEDSFGNVYTVNSSVNVPCGHSAQEIKNKKDADCTAEGYTGDNVCIICGEILEAGTVVPAKGHIWDSGKITLAAENKKEGEKTFTCTICGETRIEPISAEGSGEPDEDVDEPMTGKIYKNKNFSYMVSDYSGGQGEAEITAVSNKSVSSFSIPGTVKYKDTLLKVTSVGDKAFKKCTKLKSVTIGKNVTVIGQEAFFGCKNLKTIKGGSGLKEIGIKAFYGCTSLKKVNLASKKLVKIKDFAFAKCTSLNTFKSVSANLSYIGKKAFWNDTKLKSVTFKTKKLKASHVGANAFKGINGKCRFKVPSKSVKSYQKIFRTKGAGKKIIVMKG